MSCQAQVNDSKGPVGGDVANVLYSCSLFWVSCTFPVYRALFPMAFISLGRIRVSPCWEFNFQCRWIWALLYNLSRVLGSLSKQKLLHINYIRYFLVSNNSYIVRCEILLTFDCYCFDMHYILDCYCFDMHYILDCYCFDNHKWSHHIYLTATVLIFTKGPVGGDVANVLYSCSFFLVSCTFPVYRALSPMAFISLGRIRVSPCWRSWTFSLRRGLVTWGVVGIGTLTYWYWLTGCWLCDLFVGTVLW